MPAKCYVRWRKPLRSLAAQYYVRWRVEWCLSRLPRPICSTKTPFLVPTRAFFRVRISMKSDCNARNEPLLLSTVPLLLDGSGKGGSRLDRGFRLTSKKGVGYAMLQEAHKNVHANHLASERTDKVFFGVRSTPTPSRLAPPKTKSRAGSAASHWH